MSEFPITDEAGVCNLALELIKKPPIGSLDDGTLAAGVCRRHFGQARDTALRDRDWNFAEAKASIAALAAAPAFGFTKAYALPSDCVRALAVYGAGRDEWKVVGRTIETDLAAPLLLTYTSNAVPIVSWDPAFVSALAALLAVAIAPRLLGRGVELERLKQEAEGAFADAGAVDSREAAPTRLKNTDITLARSGVEVWRDDGGWQ